MTANPDELQSMVAAVKEEQLRRLAADGDIAAYWEYTLRDTNTGGPITIYKYQHEWAQILRNEQFIVIFAPMEHGKSELISVGYPVFTLGRDTSERVITVSGTGEQASKFLVAGSAHITENRRVRKIYPHLKPKPHPRRKSSDLKWSDSAIIIDRETEDGDPLISKDFSWQAVGVEGSVLGSRATKIVIDDAVDFENSRTVGRRKKVVEWMDEELFSRLQEGGQFICIGTAWMDGDLYHELSRRPNFFSIRYSVEPGDVKRGFHLANWPGKKKWLNSKKDTIPGASYKRQYRCITNRSEDTSFPSVEKAFHYVEDPKDYILTITDTIHKTTAGVDLSSSRRPGNFIIGTAHTSSHKIVIHVESGSWKSPQTARRIIGLDTELNVDEWIVETNGYQGSLREWIQELDETINITSFTTTTQKSDPEIGLPSLESEFANNKWVIPLPFHTEHVVLETSADNCRCDYCRFAKELVFHPGASDTDSVMALWFSRGRKVPPYYARIRSINSKTGNEYRPKITLAAYNPDNRVSKERGYIPPPDVGELTKLFSAMTIPEAESLIFKADWGNDYPNHNPEVLQVLLLDMINFCKVLAA